MPLLEVIVILIIVGLLLWAVRAIVPMDAQIWNIIRTLVIVVVCLWILSLFVPWGSWTGIRIGR